MLYKPNYQPVSGSNRVKTEQIKKKNKSDFLSRVATGPELVLGARSGT